MGGKSIGQIDDIGIRTRLTDPTISGGNLSNCEVTSPLRGGTIVSITATGAVTLTTTQLSAPLIALDCGGSARNVTTPTGAQLSAAFPDVAEDECVVLAKFSNVSDADEDATLVAGTDVTLWGTAARNEGTTCSLVAVLTSAADDEWTIYIEG